eukprot:Lithocolla_globosa_v1_NODE_6498_length_1077_cov_10.157534.p2 type:complete len:161 gc:universal NODE_6498_length_1077_cov_10.157534:715-233(-)
MLLCGGSATSAGRPSLASSTASRRSNAAGADTAVLPPPSATTASLLFEGTAAITPVFNWARSCVAGVVSDFSSAGGEERARSCLMLFTCFSKAAADTFSSFRASFLSTPSNSSTNWATSYWRRRYLCAGVSDSLRSFSTLSSSERSNLEPGLSGIVLPRN